MIDSHQHFWKLGQFDYSWLEAEELSSIRRDFLPDDLQPVRESVGISHSVVVQTQHCLDENRWALKMADTNESIAGVVGWVDLASPDVEQQLLEFKDHPKFVGIRHVTQDEPDDNFIIREDILRGLKSLEKHAVPFDLLFYEKHLHHAVAVAKHVPDLPLVIDHLSKPLIKSGEIREWADNLKAAAKFQNVYCKLSGMITEADWTSWKPDDLRPYVETAIEAFGLQRCMFGSDWPVCLLAGSYNDVVNALNDVLGPISESERSQLFMNTAKTFYQLSI